MYSDMMFKYYYITIQLLLIKGWIDEVRSLGVYSFYNRGNNTELDTD
jgi:hypothetical protein